MFNIKIHAHGGFTPAASAPPKYDNSLEGNTALSRSAGAVREGQTLSPPSSHQCFVFHIMVNGILQS